MKITSTQLAMFCNERPTTVKRWVRMFLPSDEKAKRRSGYAREMTLNQAFTVFFGGALVGGLRYGVADAKKIIKDLRAWMMGLGLYPDTPHFRPDTRYQTVQWWTITIFSNKDFFYKIKGIIESKETSTISSSPVGDGFEKYLSIYINCDLTDCITVYESKIDIESLLRQFITAVQCEAAWTKKYKTIHPLSLREIDSATNI